VDSYSIVVGVELDKKSYNNSKQFGSILIDFDLKCLFFSYTMKVAWVGYSVYKLYHIM